MLHIDESKTIINMDESIFHSNLPSFSKDKNLGTNVKENIESITQNYKNVCQQINNGIKYYRNINILLQNAFEDTKNMSWLTKKSTRTSQFTEIVEEVGQEYEDDDDDIYKYDDQNIQEIDSNIETDERNSAKQKLLKYWIKVQKNVLFTYAYLIAPQRGLLLEYLDANSTNYKTNIDDSEQVPIKFDLTITILKYIESLFSSVDKSLYSRIFTDELVLLFLMVHWISFKNLYQSHLSPWNSPKAINPPSFFQENIVDLWKHHLKCICVLVNNRSPIIRKNLYQLKMLHFLVSQIESEYNDSQYQLQIEQENVFKKYSDPIKQVTQNEINQYLDTSNEVISNESDDNPTSAKIEVRPKMGGFNLALDLNKVAIKGKDTSAFQNLNFENKYPKENSKNDEHENSSQRDEQASNKSTPKADENNHNYDDSSSSSGYGFVPPPELNPNLCYEKKSTTQKVSLGLGGGFSFKLNLNNVEGANIITKEDRSRIQELGSNAPATYNKPVNLKLEGSSSNTPEISNDINNNTTKAAQIKPMIPKFGLGFKLDLTKVPEANVITDEDKAKVNQASYPKIAKNNFTETASDIKGNKPKKLKVKSKDSTTKLPNDSSVPNLKVGKIQNIKKLGDTRNSEFEVSNLDKSIGKKGIRNIQNKSLIIENSDVSSMLDTESDHHENHRPLIKKISNKRRSNFESEDSNKLVPNYNKPNNSGSQSQNSNNSNKSKGSYVGSNRIFIPSLNIQEDVINKEIREKQKLDEEIKIKREQDKHNPKFHIQKSNKNNKKNRNLLALANSNQSTLKVDTQVGSPENMFMSSSKEFTIVGSGSKQNNLSEPFNPIALNLSRIGKNKTDLGEPKNLAMKNLNLKSLSNTNTVPEKSKHQMTVTLAPEINANYQFENQILQLNPEYENARNTIGIYSDEDLHCSMLQLIFTLIITPERGTLDDLYCSRKPLEEDKPHVLHYLHYHFNHEANKALIPKMLKKVQSKFTQNSGTRLMKLLCKTLFDKNLYIQDSLIAKGAYGNVYE